MADNEQHPIGATDPCFLHGLPIPNRRQFTVKPLRQRPRLEPNPCDPSAAACVRVNEFVLTFVRRSGNQITEKAWLTLDYLNR